MAYIDPHIHMVSRTTDDYRAMAQAGCVAITEPAFWAGFDRSSPAGFFDYFRQLTEVEPSVRLSMALRITAGCVSIQKKQRTPSLLVKSWESFLSS